MVLKYGFGRKVGRVWPGTPDPGAAWVGRCNGLVAKFAGPHPTWHLLVMSHVRRFTKEAPSALRSRLPSSRRRRAFPRPHGGIPATACCLTCFWKVRANNCQHSTIFTVTLAECTKIKTRSREILTFFDSNACITHARSLCWQHGHFHGFCVPMFAAILVSQLRLAVLLQCSLVSVL